MNKVVLINPPFNISKANYGSSISVGLLCLASFLDKHGVEVVIIDGVRQDNYIGRVKAELPGAALVGFSVMTMQVGSALRISELIKEARPHLPIVWGGIQATLFPRETAAHPLVDIAVVGEGEQTLLELVQSGVRREELNGIKGIAFKAGRKVVVTGPRSVLKTDYLPLPKWELMPKEVWRKISLIPAYTSRGCPHRCAFCINSITKNRWRGFSAERVLTMLEKMREQPYFRGKPIRFWDENFFTDIERARQIVQGMVDRGWIMPWETTVRVDYIRNGLLDDNFLRLMRKSGCYLLSFGGESGSEHVLGMIDKGITPQQIIDSAEKTLSHGIIPQYSFMVGLPGENRRDMRQTIDVIDKLFKLSPKIQVLGPQAFRPYPGSVLYQRCTASGWRAPRSLDEWSQLVSDELNYLSPRNFPWVRNVGLVEALEAYVRFGAHPVKSAMGSTVKTNKWLKLMFVLLCKLRWKLKFFKWPLEFKIARQAVTKI